MEILKWARSNGCKVHSKADELNLPFQGQGEWNSDTCSNAAKGGHLEVLKWAHENGCEWDNVTCSEANADKSKMILVMSVSLEKRILK